MSQSTGLQSLCSTVRQAQAAPVNKDWGVFSPHQVVLTRWFSVITTQTSFSGKTRQRRDDIYNRKCFQSLVNFIYLNTNYQQFYYYVFQAIFFIILFLKWYKNCANVICIFQGVILLCAPNKTNGGEKKKTSTPSQMTIQVVSVITQH